MAHTNTLSKFTIEFLRDFQQNVVMVLQPHNSKFTIEFLQDFQTLISIKLCPKLTPKLNQALCNN